MDFSREQLSAVLRSLHVTLMQLRDSINSLRNQQEKQNKQQWELPRSPIKVEAAIYEKENAPGKKKSTSERQVTVQWVIAGGTWFAFIAAVFYAGVAAYQLKAYKAVEAAQVNIQNLDAKAVTEKDRLGKETLFVNISYDINISGHATSFDLEEGSVNAPYSQELINRVACNRNESLPLGVSGPIRTHIEEPIRVTDNPDDIKEFTNNHMYGGRMYWAWVVQISWRDIFGRPNSTWECIVHRNGPREWAPCQCVFPTTK